MNEHLVARSHILFFFALLVSHTKLIAKTILRCNLTSCLVGIHVLSRLLIANVYHPSHGNILQGVLVRGNEDLSSVHTKLIAVIFFLLLHYNILLSVHT